MEDVDPHAARTEAEFVSQLRRLKDRSGFTYRQLERRAKANGDVLPHSTLANTFARDSLPRATLVAAFIRACGLDDETVQSWVNARNNLSAPPLLESKLDTAEPPVGSRLSRPVLVGIAAALVLLLGGVAAVLLTH